jgi:hypothetical protein
MASLDGARFVVKSVTRGERRRNPAPRSSPPRCSRRRARSSASQRARP